MAKSQQVLWLKAPEKHDLGAALDYLSLVMPQQDAERYTKALRDARHVIDHRCAKDILRASGLPLLPKSNVHVAKDLAKIAKGEKLSPVLLVRGNWNRPLLIADGYHRVIAVYLYSEDTAIPCVLI